MKYLKSYNENIDLGYQKIDRTEYLKNIAGITRSDIINTDIVQIVNYRKERFESFTSKEVNEIQTFIPKFNISSNSDSMLALGSGDNFLIWKLKDEWYYVCRQIGGDGTNDYYKCDQFDGLMNLLKSLQNKYVKENLYSELSQNDDFNIEDPNNFENFTTSEKNIITDTLSDYISRKLAPIVLNSLKPAKVEDSTICIYHRDFHNYMMDMGPKAENSGFYITKFKDEWFYVYDYRTNKRYRCDQFDGLIKLLNDLK